MTLLLDLSTIESAPRFFALLSLVMRASGFEIVVMDGDAKRRKGEKIAAGLGVPLGRYEQWSGSGDAQAYKSALADLFLQKGKVVWVDEELGRWKGPNVDREGLVVLNWRKVLEAGGVTAPAARG